MSRYCGLSGLLNSLLATGIYVLWRERRDPVVLLVAAGAVAKITFEGLSGQAVFTYVAWPSVPIVHGVGFATGLIMAVLRYKALACVSRSFRLLVQSFWRQRTGERLRTRQDPRSPATYPG